MNIDNEIDLIKLVQQTKETIGNEYEFKKLINEISSKIDLPTYDIEQYFYSDDKPEIIFKRILNQKNIVPKKLSIEEMENIVKKIINIEGSEEISDWIRLLEISIPCPKISDLIFWSKVELTPKQIIEEAKKYRIIQL